MSARSGIAKGLASVIGTSLNGTGIYVNNIYENVTNKVVHFDDIQDFPYISVTPGPESREDMPSNFTWATITMYIRIYVENNEDAQGELESLISDIENVVDTHLNLSYNVTTSQGLEIRNTVDNSIITITTDEGLLDPNALGEVVLEVRYEKIRQTF
jgi:hypothetical protein|tara:strand:+ start:1955 stop:2425 length:471 start_codon:yes stop_codon:yes gene_type:complete